MRKIIALLLAAGVILWCPMQENRGPRLYPACGEVTEVDRAADTVTFRDGSGNLWAFYGAEDWMPGDMCACIMSDAGTPEIIDDQIIMAEYAGTF